MGKRAETAVQLKHAEAQKTEAEAMKKEADAEDKEAKGTSAKAAADVAKAEDTKQKTAEKEMDAALKKDGDAKEAKACECSGQTDKDNEGGSCKDFGWRMPWCYVAEECADQAAKMKGKLKWLPGCHQMGNSA